MKRVVVVLCAGVVLIAAIFASNAGAGAGVKAVKDCTKPQNRPGRIVIGCADFSLFVNSLHWDAWKSDKAKGSGVLQLNDCSPDCASGTFNQYPVDIKLSKPKQVECGNKTVNLFRHYSLTYTGSKPANAGRIAEGKLACV